MMKDVGRCPRCDRFLVAEQYETHRCTIPIKSVNEIFLDWINEGVQNDDEDVVYVAMGLDGILYRLILCEHNPPHNIRRDFTGRNSRRRLDRTMLTQYLLE